MSKDGKVYNPVFEQINQTKIDCLNTGDIDLCHGDKNDDIIDRTIEEFTHSPFVHAAMIIVDTWWTSPPLKGIYVFQSGGGPNSYPDVLNGKALRSYIK